MTSEGDHPGLSRPRYSTLEFPSYRFVPGRNPHPIAHPQGHSFRRPGEGEPVVHWHPPESWRQSEDYLHACDLYNHAYWWEAHEAWEGLWRVTPKGSAQHAFLQGLIQVSACHLKLYMGRLDGVARLRETSLAYLRAAFVAGDGHSFMGLELGTFIADVVGYYEGVMKAENGPPRHDAERYPYMVLTD